ncbi:patatin-like phospholipase family protein [Oceanicaulis sp. MMSF_3324]|uniref:patatin-like phospholipase family protein n=1 Tax=Oceanicaulis sp. MMSF_3324 TaxID=3046702 RepID=UPI00273F3C85|nr:patatin-like phospholipase family protein [Oceanicaulis sp. MMSF_3324]
MKLSFLYSALMGALASACVTTSALSCDFEDNDGPDVALVLSGGGALVSTQIGALQVIEELGVPIHCVVGTSMGAVVGGLYAAGYSAAEIEDIFVYTDWAEVFSGRPPREDQSYLQSERSSDYLTGALIGLGDEGVRLPGGMRSMHGLRRHFRELTFHVPLDADFDGLAVPYRAVVTDFATGDAVALSSGDLVQSMLASMAVPGAFQPRQIDDALYVDGGMAAQLPVRVAQEMGADIIIAIDTTVEPPAPSASPSMADTMQQLIRVSVWRNRQEDVARLGPDDLLLTPSLDGLSTTAFERAPHGVAAGVQEARRHEAQLRAISALAAPPIRRDLPRTRPSQMVQAEMRVVNATALDDQVLSARANVSRALEEDEDVLTRRLNALTAFGALGEADLAQDSQGLVLMVDERDIGRSQLEGGVRLSNTFEGDSTFSVLARYSRRPFSRHGGDFSLSLELGTTNGLEAVLQQPFGAAGRYFYEPSLYYEGEEVPLNIGEVRLGEFWDQKAGARLRVGRELGDWGVLYAGGEVRRGRTETKVSLLPEIDPLIYTLAGFGGGLRVDTLDHFSWPTRGLALNAEAFQLYSVGNEGSDTLQLQLSGLRAFELGQTHLLAGLRAGSVENRNDDPVDLISLGGFRSISAYPQNAIPTNGYVYGSLEAYERLDQAGPLFNVPVYWGVLLEAAYVELDFLGEGEAGATYSGAVYLGVDTVLGPAIFGGALGEEGAGGIFIHLGSSF